MANTDMGLTATSQRPNYHAAVPRHRRRVPRWAEGRWTCCGKPCCSHGDDVCRSRGSACTLTGRPVGWCKVKAGPAAPLAASSPQLSQSLSRSSLASHQ
eukprot:2623025-Rhodomonas_salina.2